MERQSGLVWFARNKALCYNRRLVCILSIPGPSSWAVFILGSCQRAVPTSLHPISVVSPFFPLSHTRGGATRLWVSHTYARRSSSRLHRSVSLHSLFILFHGYVLLTSSIWIPMSPRYTYSIDFPTFYPPYSSDLRLFSLAQSFVFFDGHWKLVGSRISLSHVVLMHSFPMYLFHLFGCYRLYQYVFLFVLCHMEFQP